MFSAIAIAAAMVYAFATVFVFDAFRRRGQFAAARTAVRFGIAAAIYCVAAGVYLLLGWQDPFAGADPVQYGKAIAQGGGRGGVVLLILRFWPFVLIAFGGHAAYTNWPLLGYPAAPAPTPGSNSPS